MVIIGVAWFNSPNSVGVVVVEDNNGDEHSYIAGIDPNIINSEESDAIRIANWGGRFPLDVGKDLVEKHGTITKIEY